MKTVNLKSVEEIEQLQAKIIKLERQNNELIQIAEQANELVNSQYETIEMLVKSRDSFIELAKQYAETLGYNTFEK